MRTVSLFPSATELVAGIGAVDDLVGRSHQCDHPAAVRDLPAVTVSKLSERAPDDAGEIDAVVDDHHHGEDTYFRVVTGELQAVRPEVLITQSLCEVCAVPGSMTAETAAALDPTPETVSLGPTTIDGILDAVTELGDVLGRETGAERARTRIRGRIDDTLARRPHPPRPPRVVCLEWTDALRCHGLWVPEMLERLGADPGFGRPGDHGRRIDWDDLVDYDPGVLVVSPCGRSIPEIRRDMATLVDRPGWDDLTAVETGGVYLLDGAMSSRHGPRVARTLELLAAALYPDTYDDIDPGADELVRFDAGAG